MFFSQCRFLFSPVQRVGKIIMVFAVFGTIGTLSFAQAPFLKAQKPKWVQDVPIPPEVLYGVVAAGEQELSIYTEMQVNFLTDETYERLVMRVDADSNENKSYNLWKEYFPVDDSLYVIGFTWLRDGRTRTQPEQILESSTEHFVSEELFYQKDKLSFCGSHGRDGDLLIVEFLTKNLRTDIGKLPILSVDFSTEKYHYVSAMSPVPLSTLEIQGMAAPTMLRSKDHYRYVWQGIGVWDSLESRPSWHSGTSCFVLTPFNNNEELLHWKRKLYEIDASSTAAVNRIQQAIAPKSMSDADKIVAIINYLQDSITYQKYGLYEPKMPLETIANGYGDCKSKSLLGAELFNAAGIASWPLMVQMSGYKYQQKEISSPQKFDHCVVQYVYQEDTFTVDATAENQGDRIGYHPHNAFRRGLRILPNGSREVVVPLAKTASTLEVTDRYNADHHTIRRTLIATGEEADALRKLYQYHGLKGVNMSLTGGSKFENGYEHVLGIGFGYMCDWERSGDLKYKSWNTADSNRVAIELLYIPSRTSSIDFPDFELDHFIFNVEAYDVFESLKEVTQRDPRVISHRLIVTGSMQDLEIDSHSFDARINDDLPVYSNSVLVFEDSAVLEQRFHIPREVSFDQAKAYNELLTKVEAERNYMKGVPEDFNDLIPNDPNRLTRQVLLEMVGSSIAGISLVFFGIVGLVQSIKGIRRKRRFKKLVGLRKALLLLFAMYVSNGYAQNMTLSAIPAWVASYAVDTTLAGNEGIQMVQKEVQVNTALQQVFYRNVYEVNRPGAPGTNFFSVYYDATVDTVELVAFHVIRNGKQLNMTSGRIQRFYEHRLSARGNTLKRSVCLNLFNDQFEKRDLLTVAYLIRPKQLKKDPLHQYEISADQQGIACRYLFRVLHEKEALQEQHFRGFKAPKQAATEQGQEWLWDEVFKLEKAERWAGTFPKKPSWFIESPQVQVFATTTEKQLAEHMWSLPRFRYTPKALARLQSYLPDVSEKSVTEKVLEIQGYLEDSLVVYEIALGNEALGYEVQLLEKVIGEYQKAVLFSKALETLGVKNELFLVRKGGLDESYSEVLSSAIFTHAMVRYWLEGELCYFDPLQDRVGEKPSLYRKFNYKYGLNLTNPTNNASLSPLDGLPENRILIHDTVLLSGQMHRVMILEGEYADDARNVEFDAHRSVQERLLSGYGLKSLGSKDLVRGPYGVKALDSFSYQDMEQAGVRLFLSYDVNNGMPVNPRVDSGVFRETSFYSQLYELYGDRDLDKHERVIRPQLEMVHTLTVPDSFLHKLEVPDIHLAVNDASFERTTSFKEGLFTVGVMYYSAIDFMSRDGYNQEFDWAISYDVLEGNPLTEKGLLNYHTNLNRRSSSWKKVGEILLALPVLLLFFFPLFGLYKSIVWLRFRRKRKARLKRLLAAAV